MSGTASVQNTFQSAVTATGLQLDQNYSTIVAYLNDPTNRNNYSGDGGATNTVVLTFAPPVVGGYTAGLELAWKWGVTNTGPVVLNANGLGNINVVNPDGTALQAGQGKVGSIGKAIYDGTRAIYISSSAQRFGEAKAWGYVTQTTGSYTLTNSYGVSGIERGGTGSLTITLITAMSNTIYPVLASPLESSQIIADQTVKTTSTFRIRVINITGTAVTESGFQFVVYGAQ